MRNIQRHCMCVCAGDSNIWQQAGNQCAVDMRNHLESCFKRRLNAFVQVSPTVLQTCGALSIRIHHTAPQPQVSKNCPHTHIACTPPVQVFGDQPVFTQTVGTVPLANQKLTGKQRGAIKTAVRFGLAALPAAGAALPDGVAAEVERHRTLLGLAGEAPVTEEWLKDKGNAIKLLKHAAYINLRLEAWQSPRAFLMCPQARVTTVHMQMDNTSLFFLRKVSGAVSRFTAMCSLSCWQPCAP